VGLGDRGSVSSSDRRGEATLAFNENPKIRCVGSDGPVSGPRFSSQVLIDAREIDDGARLTSDLVVVGAGPAGISIVDRLRFSELSICLIDGGGFLPDRRTQRLCGGESIGAPYFRLDACRFREFGGSGNRWGGCCRPLNPVDFKQRDWLPWSGWPIDRAELEPFYADAAELLQLPTWRFAEDEWPARMPPPLDMSGTDFENTIFEYSPVTDFGVRYRDRIVHAKHVTTLLHANVTELLLDPDGRRIDAVQVRTLTARSFRVQGRAVVLAAGGIENPRLLLASGRARPAGIGNERDLVGRFFMEHLHTPAGHLKSDESLVSREFYRHATYAGRRVRGLLTPTAQAQTRHGLLGCSIAIDAASYAGDTGSPFVQSPPALRMAYLQLQRVVRREVATELKHWARFVWDKGQMIDTWRSARAAQMRDPAASDMRRGQVLSLYVRAEQAPNPSSRVSLSQRKDALGVPRPRLDWRLQDADTGSILAWLAELDAEMRGRAVAHVIKMREDWGDRIVGGPHHMGTTRMSGDPKTGVVDAQCRVHSVENLYIAGSSVFSTSGWSNPTFTIVALALRLADELERSLTREPHEQ